MCANGMYTPSPMSSPFAAHLDTNYSPSDAEIQEIRAHLVPFEAELGRLEALIRDLGTKSRQIKDYIDSHMALTSHSRRLPQELIENIFLECLPTHRNAIMSSSEAPLLLCRICSAWRSVALSLPRLWASIHFQTYNRNKSVAVVEWLSRSASAPLAIFLNCGDRQALPDCLHGQSARWRSLHLSNIRAPRLLEQVARIGAPMLDDLKISICGFDEAQSTQVLTSNLVRNMAFGRVVLHSQLPDSLLPTDPFTWEHLAHLTLDRRNEDGSFTGTAARHGLSFRSAYTLLRGCPRLVSLAFQLDKRRDPEVISESALALPAMQSFTILPGSRLSLAMLKNLVGHLNMSNLRYFQTTRIRSGLLEFRGTNMADATLFALLAERSPAISYLGVDLADFSKDLLTDILRLFPALTGLRAETDTISAAWLLDTLTPPVKLLPCPALQKLNIVMDDNILPDELWLAFLRAHMDHGTRLRRFELSSVGPAPRILPNLEPFFDRGLQVSLKYVQ